MHISIKSKGEYACIFRPSIAAIWPKGKMNVFSPTKSERFVKVATYLSVFIEICSTDHISWRSKKWAKGFACLIWEYVLYSISQSKLAFEEAGIVRRLPVVFSWSRTGFLAYLEPRAPCRAGVPVANRVPCKVDPSRLIEYTSIEIAATATWTTLTKSFKDCIFVSCWDLPFRAEQGGHNALNLAIGRQASFHSALAVIGVME